MGAKIIPHLLANLDEGDITCEYQEPQLSFDAADISSLYNAQVLALFDGMSQRPKEAQGPAKLIASDQMESLLVWYI